MIPMKNSISSKTRMATIVASRVGVNVRQRTVEQLVVVPELEQLRVGELEDLERCLRAGGSIVHERRVSGWNHEIVGANTCP